MMAFLVIWLFAVPVVLTGYNILSCLDSLRPEGFFRKRRKLLDFLIVINGFVLLYVWVEDICGDVEWYKPVIIGGGMNSNHAPISGLYGELFYLPVLIGAIFLLIMLYSEKRRPPLVTVFMIAVVMIAVADLFLLVIQLIYNDNDKSVTLAYCIPPLVYAVNYLLVTVRAMRREISAQLEYLSHNKENSTGLSHKLYVLLDKSYKWVIAGFVLLLPIIAIVTIVFILAGQGADGAIKAFTETADWTFSTKTPPPPEQYEGHYLCTVAAGGHRKVVKPTRYGVRLNEKIIVNRQLCVANAFEDLIKDKTPRFHKSVRGFYDKHGYPLCKKITTPLRADIVYILMKPLEWLFLLTLYTFDTDPERRIAVQYTGKTLKDI